MSRVFCKQKTAYERRISDWSSDVCSSDLIANIGAARRGDEKGVATIGARIGIVRETVALGRKIFEFGLLGTGQFACDADRCDGCALGLSFIESKRLCPARQARQMLDPADDPADEGNTELEVMRRVSDHRLKYIAAA